MTIAAAPNKIDLALAGVPETLLWPLWFRAEEARKNDGFFSDPLGVEVANRISFDFAKFGRPSRWHAIRAKYSDQLISQFLRRNPRATIVALGEGLETQFWRLDNGSVTWVSVDLPESIAARRRLLPSSPRNELFACSAFDPAWMSQIDPTNGLFISAAGLLMYFPRSQTLELLAAVAAQFPSWEMFFDTIPPWFSKKTLKGLKISKSYTAPAMPFGLRLSEVNDLIYKVSQIKIISVISYPEAYPQRSPLLSALSKLHWFRDITAGLVHLERKNSGQETILNVATTHGISRNCPIKSAYT